MANELKAAAIAYGVDKKVDNQQNVFCCDLRCGSLKAFFLSTGGDTPLGSEKSLLDWRMTVCVGFGNRWDVHCPSEDGECISKDELDNAKHPNACVGSLFV